MEDFNNSISIHAKTANNIYTLFALIVLESIEKTPEELAAKYEEFMILVETFKDEELSVEQNRSQKNNKPPNWDSAYIYYTNTLGASTEPPQRVSRYEALKAALL